MRGGVVKELEEETRKANFKRQKLFHFYTHSDG
jgi:hypothetical protein